MDFRELVRDLAAHFRTRIEMLRQIGVRDEAWMLALRLVRPSPLHDLAQSFEPVSIKMASRT